MDSNKSKFATSSDITIEGKATRCLLDTGAQTSFISERYAKERSFSIEKVKKPKNWVTANGSPLSIIGQTTIELKVGRSSCPSTFIIAKDLSYDVIIGIDILKPRGFVIDFKNQTLNKGQETIPINAISRRHTKVGRAMHDIEIDPFETITHEIDLNDISSHDKILVERLNNVDIIEGVSSVNSNKIKIIIQNYQPIKRKIHKNFPICKLSSCNIVSEVNNGEDLREIIEHESKKVHVASINESKKWRPSSKIKINENLPKADKEKLKALVDKYWEIFSKDEEDIGTVLDKYGEHDIVLSAEKPIRQKPYRIPYAKEKVVNDCIEKMLKLNIIEQSNSEWASPIVLVKKSDGSERFCVDYRKVNETTIKDSFPMPNIEEKLNKLHGCRFFTSLDCLSGYWQIKLTPRAKQITAFICSKGLYQFKVMPFGLCNAGATFQRIMEMIIAGLDNSSAYIDDVFSYSKTFEEHLNHLEQLFIRLKEANMKIKTSKCELACQETMFLGFRVGKDGVRIDENRIKAMRNYPKPKTTKKDLFGHGELLSEIYPEICRFSRTAKQTDP